MGACSFTALGEHSDIREAFNLAHEDAQYERGHGGYTGSPRAVFVSATLPAGSTGGTVT